jgi:hypothetical protein
MQGGGILLGADCFRSCARQEAIALAYVALKRFLTGASLIEDAIAVGIVAEMRVMRNGSREMV